MHIAVVVGYGLVKDRPRLCGQPRYEEQFPQPGQMASICVGCGRPKQVQLHDEVWAGLLDATAAQFGVKIIGLYNALPDHVEFLIAEAENAAAIAMFLSTANPYGEIAETVTKSVVTHTQLLELGKQMMAGAAEPAS